ncbi:MAG: NusA-like transcription termination signal-binding factor [Candidatus Diapherotrites archaeon]|nr:NusA-like transcription termination signal-binding factor [Candidatus Diapherotrites archaeon]
MKLNREEIEYLNLLEKECNQNATACVITENAVVFFAEKGKVGAVVGKNGENAKKMSSLIGKQVEVFEYSGNPEEFAKKAFNKTEVEAKALKNALSIKFVSAEDKKKALMNKRRISLIKEILNKCFGIKKVMIN